MTSERSLWAEFTSKPLVELDDFYAANKLRKSGGRRSFGFDWKDPSVTERDTFCEVYWYPGSQEVAAVYSTYDRERLAQLLRQGRASTSIAGFGGAPIINDGAAAAMIGRWLGDRDLATLDTKVRVMGELEHPLECYWVLRDAFFLETKPDGLLTLQQRIDACAHGERRPVAEHPLWERLSEWLGTSEGQTAVPRG